jgi:lipopolysaccharide/colanic/teichoic acid biosynthesis glycosyltransferase
LKRTFDFLAAGVGLILLSPLFVAIAVAIKLDSRGPVFFRQERMGRGGRVFRIFKFRTMVVDGERLGAPITVGDDPRITQVGRTLRRFKLDELPQLINVMRGEMSLVGPRPELPRYRDRYEGVYDAVLQVRPGITDPASLRFRDEADLLSGREDPETYYLQSLLPQKLRLNLEYVRRATLSRDIGIILLTLLALFKRNDRHGHEKKANHGVSQSVTHACRRQELELGRELKH